MKVRGNIRVAAEAMPRVRAVETLVSLPSLHA